MKVDFVLDLVRHSDWVPQKFLKKLSGESGLWEVRVRTSFANLRLLGFFAKEGDLVLVSGFFKKSAKTPLYEIQQAREMIRKCQKIHAE